jgi:hypothetical protein
MVTVARVPIEAGDLKNIPPEGLPLVDAYLLDPVAVIKAAEDFTLRLGINGCILRFIPSVSRWATVRKRRCVIP